MERTFSGDDLRRNNPRFSPANRASVNRLMEAIAPIAERHRATESQVVIAWTLRQPGITFALCGSDEPRSLSRTDSGSTSTCSGPA
jgi:aryl-alcohol dehydrogenase-like predicted oxidoreductase